MGVPAVAQQVQQCLWGTGMQVWYLAWHSGLGIQCCQAVARVTTVACIWSLAQELHMLWGSPPPPQKGNNMFKILKERKCEPNISYLANDFQT